MITAIIIFCLIVIVPYSIYFKKRYDDSKLKKVFLKENLYKSTIWILPVIVIPIIIVNLLFSLPEETTPTPEKVRTIEAFKTERINKESDINFHQAYLNKYFESTHSNSWDQDLKSYYQKIYHTDTLNDIGAWGLGFIYLKLNQPDSSIYFLSQISNADFPHINYFMAESYEQMGIDSLSELYLIRETEIVNGDYEKAFDRLQNRLISNRNLGLANKVRILPQAPEFIHPQVIRKIYFDHREFIGYWDVVWRWYRHDINAIGFIAAILILAVWFTYLIKLSLFDSINWLLVCSTLLLGMASTFLTFLISDTFNFSFNLWRNNDQGISLFLYTVFSIGAIEELVKIIPLLFIITIYKAKLQPYDYILLASVSALGFAFIENLLYFDGYEYGTIIHARALASAVGHMVNSSIFAYGLMCSHYKKKQNIVRNFILYWLLASLSHGLYDYFLFTQLLFFFIMFLFLITRVWNTIINNSLNNCSNFKYTEIIDLKSIQFFLALSLTSILMFEYLVSGYLYGTTTANLNLSVAAFSGSFLIMFLGSKLSSIDLVKGYWNKANLSVNPFTDDVVPQNFIGEKIILSPYYLDDGLALYFPNGVSGRIVNRIVLQNKPATFFMTNSDPDWFLIKLDKPFHGQIYRENQVLIKLKDPHSSLNVSKPIMVLLLLIPKKIPTPKKMRSNFDSLGWAFLESNTEQC